METEFYLPETFPTQESAIEAAIQAGRQKIDMGFERGSVVVNGWARSSNVSSARKHVINLPHGPIRPLHGSGDHRLG
jgi:hypothetical protein